MCILLLDVLSVSEKDYGLKGDLFINQIVLLFPVAITKILFCFCQAFSNFIKRN